MAAVALLTLEIVGKVCLFAKVHLRERQGLPFVKAEAVIVARGGQATAGFRSIKAVAAGDGGDG